MISRMNGLMPPYKLPSNVVYFHDWRYVDVGQHKWVDSNGVPVPLWGEKPLPAVHLNLDAVPHGIRIELQPACADEMPVLTADSLEEPTFNGGTTLYEEGRYRLFYESLPPGFLELAHENHYQLLRYAESDDGIDWSRPSLSIYELNRDKKNNIIFGGALTGNIGLHGASVFMDVSKSPSERYKMLFVGIFSPKQLEQYRETWPDDIDPLCVPPYDRGGNPFALFGAVSPDGLHWKLISEPLLIQHSDTANVCTYDEQRGKYVAYLRSWFYGRRTIARSETDDFHHFPAPEQLVWPDPTLGPSETWYYSGYTKMPDASDYHIMFANRWSLETDSFTTFLFTSPDGVVWSSVRGGPVTELGPKGSWYQNGLYFGALLPIPGDRIGCLATGLGVPHKYPRRKPFWHQMQGGWVHWPKDRITALKAQSDGEFSLYPLCFEGRRLILNYRTRSEGHIQVAVEGIKGRSFEDCDVINGDELNRVVTWQGQSDIGHKDDQPVTIKFRMRHSDLFSVKFR